MTYTQLTEVERYQIQAYLRAEYGRQDIADLLGRSYSTISREINRNSGERCYRPKQAHNFAQERKENHRHTLVTDKTWQNVELLLREDLSPEQVCGKLKERGLQSVSTEWIYQYVLKDKDNGGDLYTHLRCKKKKKKRYGSQDRRGQIKNKVSIDERPAIVDERKRVGDWEMDLIIGSLGGNVLMTAVERKTRYTVIALAPNKTAEAVGSAIIDALTPFGADVKTLTYDNGKEFAHHETVNQQLTSKSYFAHPYHSWERGLNENTNGLIRQYAPKGSSFDELTSSDVTNIMDKLNNRPRKCLNFKTPNEVMFGISPSFALVS